MKLKGISPRKEKGQSLVEFAVSFVVILVILVAVADFGRALFTWLAMRDAAQEAAVYGSICPNDLARIQARARSSSRWPVDLNSPDIAVICEYFVSGLPACGSVAAVPGTSLRITILHTNFELTTPLLGGILGSQTIPIRVTAMDTILRNDNCP